MGSSNSKVKIPKRESYPTFQRRTQSTSDDSAVLDSIRNRRWRRQTSMVECRINKDSSEGIHTSPEMKSFRGENFGSDTCHKVKSRDYASEASELISRLESLVLDHRSMVEATIRAIWRKRKEWRHPKRPLVVLAAGTSALPNLEECQQTFKQVLRETHPCGVVEIDVNQFKDDNAVQRLIGLPGRASIGQLTQEGTLTAALSHCPQVIIIIDHIENATSPILRALLKLFEGRVRNQFGRAIACNRATILLATRLCDEQISKLDENLAQFLIESSNDFQPLHIETLRFKIGRFRNYEIIPRLRRHFLGQFVDHIATIYIFMPVKDSELGLLAEQELDLIWREARSKYSIEFTCDETLLKRLQFEYAAMFTGRDNEHKLRESIRIIFEAAMDEGYLIAGDIAHFTIKEDGKLDMALLNNNNSRSLSPDFESRSSEDGSSSSSSFSHHRYGSNAMSTDL